MKQRAPWFALIWFALTLAALVAFLCFAFPMYVIRPFRAQDPGQLSLALIVRAWAPGLSLLCALAGMAAGAWQWKKVRGPIARVALAGLVLFTIAFAALNRLNVFEQMFHPLDAPGFLRADQAKIDADDMVIAVSVAGQQRAYPIRTMGYHHIVNDWAGPEPIVSTY